jgi:hypothetical protein
MTHQTPAEIREQLRGMALSLATGSGPLVEPAAFDAALDAYRSAVLREEADRIDATRADFPIAVQNGINWATAEMRRHAAELRRMADETATVSPAARVHPGNRADETATETPSTRLARQSVQAMTDTLQRACPPGCVACATDESHDPQPAAGVRQDGAET